MRSGARTGARFRGVGLNGKERVPAEFDVVASSYDRLVTRNPGYLEHLRLSADRLGLAPESDRESAREPAHGGVTDPAAPLVLLDLCCGTGLSTQALQAAYPHARIWGLDASNEMLELARAKPSLAGVTFVHGDAMDPSASLRDANAPAHFDGVLMAYGIRNMADADRCLTRVGALLAPGAPICFHEYSVADSPRSKATWTAVAWTIIIPSGLITSRSTRIYRYLWRSVLAFDGVTAFEERLRLAGFTEVHTEPVTGWQKGIVHSFVARAPARASRAP